GHRALLSGEGSGSALGDEVAHVVQARLPAGEVEGGVDGPVGKDAAGIGGVLEGDHLVWPAEEHLVVAHDAAAADRTDPEFHRVPLFPHRGAVVDIVVGAAGLLVDGVGQHQGGAAGGVHLVVVVLLDDLDVVGG